MVLTRPADDQGWQSGDYHVSMACLAKSFVLSPCSEEVDNPEDNHDLKYISGMLQVSHRRLESLYVSSEVHVELEQVLLYE